MNNLLDVSNSNTSNTVQVFHVIAYVIM